MAKKRKDQRFVVGEDVEKQVFSLLDANQVQSLVDLRVALEQQVKEVESALRSAPTDLLAQSLARSTGRRGEASFEIDPDGKMVIVVSYGGEQCDPLARGTLKPAWTKRNERKPRKTPKPTPPVVQEVQAEPEPKPAPPKKKGGFIKTSVAVSETRVVDLDSILDGFDDTDGDEMSSVKDQIDEVVYDNAYTPTKKKKLRRIPNQKVKRGSVATSSLRDIAENLTGIENGDDPK